MGHSLRARMMMVEVGGDDVDLEVLTEMQERRGMLAEATAGYVAWLADRDKAAFGPRQVELRGNAIKELKTAHGRTAENVAVFQIGVETALRFAVEVGALSEQEAEEHVAESWDVLITLAKEQALLLQSQNPAERFLNLIGAAISSGRAHVAGTHGGEPDNPEAMGWQMVAREGRTCHLARAGTLHRLGQGGTDLPRAGSGVRRSSVICLRAARSAGDTKDTLCGSGCSRPARSPPTMRAGIPSGCHGAGAQDDDLPAPGRGGRQHRTRTRRSNAQLRGFGIARRGPWPSGAGTAFRALRSLFVPPLALFSGPIGTARAQLRARN